MDNVANDNKKMVSVMILVLTYCKGHI
jgi:hypothetical protein